MFRPIPSNILVTDNLQALDAFEGLSISKDENGSIDPAQDLFRTDWPGVNSGPMISQFLIQNFEMDGIVVEPKQNTLVPKLDYMTGVETWLDVQVMVHSSLNFVATLVLSVHEECQGTTLANLKQGRWGRSWSPVSVIRFHLILPLMPRLV